MPNIKTHFNSITNELFIKIKDRYECKILCTLNKSNYPILDINQLPTELQKTACDLGVLGPGVIVLVHRLVYALNTYENITCNRLTHTGYFIHHIDKNRQNCNIENLEKLTMAEHRKKHELPTITLEDFN
jgi:hypothetical protein